MQFTYIELAVIGFLLVAVTMFINMIQRTQHNPYE